jgi:phosphoadenosine phosphosulfate reductase
LKKQLKLNVKAFVPKVTAAHYDAVYGGAPEPTPENEQRIKDFSAVMKLEPFMRGMKELAPTIWLTALRKVQNPNRAGLDIVVADKNFNTIKVSPVFYWSDAEMEAYLKQHNLPNEWDYFDPAKADEKRECGCTLRGVAKRRREAASSWKFQNPNLPSPISSDVYVIVSLRPFAVFGNRSDSHHA